MANGGGDSGGPVFAGNGTPYTALGLLVARFGNADASGACINPDVCASIFVKWEELENAIGYGPLSPIAP